MTHLESAEFSKMQESIRNLNVASNNNSSSSSSGGFVNSRPGTKVGPAEGDWRAKKPTPAPAVAPVAAKPATAAAVAASSSPPLPPVNDARPTETASKGKPTTTSSNSAPTVTPATTYRGAVAPSSEIVPEGGLNGNRYFYRVNIPVALVGLLLTSKHSPQNVIATIGRACNSEVLVPKAPRFKDSSEAKEAGASAENAVVFTVEADTSEAVVSSVQCLQRLIRGDRIRTVLEELHCKIASKGDTGSIAVAVARSGPNPFSVDDRKKDAAAAAAAERRGKEQPFAVAHANRGDKEARHSRNCPPVVEGGNISKVGGKGKKGPPATAVSNTSSHGAKAVHNESPAVPGSSSSTAISGHDGSKAATPSKSKHEARDRSKKPKNASQTGVSDTTASGESTAAGAKETSVSKESPNQKSKRGSEKFPERSPAEGAAPGDAKASPGEGRKSRKSKAQK